MKHTILKFPSKYTPSKFRVKLQFLSKSFSSNEMLSFFTVK